MNVDFEPFFKRYKALVLAADEAFRRVQAEHPDEVRCSIGCSDCCNALFDLTLIESIYVNQKYRETLDPQKRAALTEGLNRADRQIYKIKKDAYKRLEAGEDEEKIIHEMAGVRSRCPMLNEENLCDIYEYRPITCRLYGIPTAINGEAHTCGISGFEPGVPYPTVNLDAIHNSLLRISADFVASLKTRHVRMADLLVPLSMALLTTYDEEYLGIKSLETEAETEKADG